MEEMKIIEAMLELEELDEKDIYSEDGVETLMDEEGISGEECGFMAGFLAS